MAFLTYKYAGYIAQIWNSGRFICWREDYSINSNREEVHSHIKKMVRFFTGKEPRNSKL